MLPAGAGGGQPGAAESAAPSVPVCPCPSQGGCRMLVRKALLLLRGELWGGLRRAGEGLWTARNSCSLPRACEQPGAGGAGPSWGRGRGPFQQRQQGDRAGLCSGCSSRPPAREVPSQHSALLQAQAGRGDAQGQGTSIPRRPVLPSSAGTGSRSRPPAPGAGGCPSPRSPAGRHHLGGQGGGGQRSLDSTQTFSHKPVVSRNFQSITPSRPTP